MGVFASSSAASPPLFIGVHTIEFFSMTAYKTNTPPATSHPATEAATDEYTSVSDQTPSLPMWSTARISLITALVMWPLALMSLIYKVFLVPHNNHITDDFTTVWEALGRFRAGVPVYSEDYSTVDPHYLYSPGGTLLLSPLTLMPGFDSGRIAYIFLNGLAIVLALAILTRLFGFRLRGGVWPTLIVAVFATESVKNTLLFSNINGLLLLAEVGFLYLLLKHRSVVAQIAAGVLLGLAITVKPQFAPLLFIPFVRRQFATVGTGIAVPVVFNIVAWPLMTAPGDYLDKLVPYLGEVRDYANSSITGVGAYFGISGPLLWFWQLLFAALTAIAIVLLMRWRDRDPIMWATTTAGVLLTGVFLLSSLGQMYYSMLLVPMLLTVVRYRSAMHNPVVWLGVYFCLSADHWHSDRFHTIGRAMENIRATVGWSAIIIAVATTVVVWTVMEIRRGAPVLGDVATGGLFGGRDESGVDNEDRTTTAQIKEDEHVERTKH